MRAKRVRKWLSRYARWVCDTHRDEIRELHMTLPDRCTAQPFTPALQRRAFVTLVHKYMVATLSPARKLRHPFQACFASLSEQLWNHDNARFLRGRSDNNVGGRLRPQRWRFLFCGLSRTVDINSEVRSQAAVPARMQVRTLSCVLV